MKQWGTLVQGFLLIEFVGSLALIGLLVTFVSLFLAQRIERQHDVTMRLQALDCATSIIERLSCGLPLEKDRAQLVVTIEHVQNRINQEVIDALIPMPTHQLIGIVDMSQFFVAVHWKTHSGIEKSVQLLTALETSLLQGVL